MTPLLARPHPAPPRTPRLPNGVALLALAAVATLIITAHGCHRGDHDDTEPAITLPTDEKPRDPETA